MRLRVPIRVRSRGYDGQYNILIQRNDGLMK